MAEKQAKLKSEGRVVTLVMSVISKSAFLKKVRKRRLPSWKQRDNWLHVSSRENVEGSGR